jgi:hypothetical protein
VYALYVFLATFTVAVLAWESRNGIGLAATTLVARRHVPVLALNLALTLLVVVTTSGQTGMEAWWQFLVPALISGLFETLYIYGWVQDRLRELLGYRSSLLGTALLYAVYHLGYLGVDAQGMDTFGLSFGLYLLVGVSNAAIVRYTRSAWSLWPGFIALSTAFDYARLRLPLTGYQAGLAPVLVAMVVLVGWLAYRSSRSIQAIGQVAAASFLVQAPGVPVWSEWRAAAQAVWQGRKQRLRVLWWVGLLLLGAGSLSRLIINDPLVLDSFRLTQPEVVARFIEPRSAFGQMILNLGFAGYLFIPLLTLVAWRDARAADRALTRGGLTSNVGALAGRLGLVAGGTLGWMAVLAPYLAVVSVTRGWSPEPQDLLRFCGLAVLTVLYALFNLVVVSALASSLRTVRWVWFAGLIGYVFIFNWWMVYALFSQYVHVPLPTTNDPIEVGQWLGQIWGRVSAMYAFIPHYQYYLGLTTGYLKNAWDHQYFLGPLSVLATYTTSFTLLAMDLATERAQRGRVS